MSSKNGNIWPDSPAGQQLQQRLQDEQVLEGIDHLLSRISTLEEAVDKLTIALEHGPGLMSMAIDAVDDTVTNAAANGIDMKSRLDTVAALLEKLTRPEVSHQISFLLEGADRAPGLIAMGVDAIDAQIHRATSQGVDFQSVAAVSSAAAAALSEASQEEPPQVGGVFGLLRALKDPDRQRGLGFLMNFLKIFGKKLG